MLQELRVENYAVIDNLVVEFGAGLNLLTGETGAGKSILIDALGLLLGQKASSDVVRHGTEKAVVAGVFGVEGAGIDEILEANGIDSNGEELIVRREISAGGKGRVWVNNQPATVAALRQLGPWLGTIHSQAESMFAFAFDAQARLRLLDEFAGIDITELGEAHARWRELGEHIAELETGEQDRLRRVDLWSFQKKEIEDARLTPGEDQELESEKRVLANAERIYGAAMAAYEQLYDGNGSAAAQIRSAIKNMEELGRFDERFRESAAALDSARITIEDMGESLRDYADHINASPERLAEIEDRLALIDRLKRKYGNSLDQVIAYGADVARRLGELEHKDEALAGLRKKLAAAAEDYLRLARRASARRFEAARALEHQAETELGELAMKAQFKIEVGGSDQEEDWTPNGLDRVKYLISTNAGEPPGPVEDIASGGELSRVMLALKVVVARGAAPRGEPRQGLTTMVFDEIDTGIGGRAAEAVGRKLKALGKTCQVLCITHLPQVASFADEHFLIEKKESGGRARTQVQRLEMTERRHEVARMLSGAVVTEVALKNATQMLKANG